MSLPDSSNTDLPIQVPFLVSGVSLDQPLIGLILIEELILGTGESEYTVPNFVSLLCHAMNILCYENATALVTSSRNNT